MSCQEATISPSISKSIENASSLRERFDISLAALRECSRALLIEQTLSDEDAVSDVDEDEAEGEDCGDNEIEYKSKSRVDASLSTMPSTSTVYHSEVAGVVRSPLSPRRVVPRNSFKDEDSTSNAVSDRSTSVPSDALPVLYPSLSPSTVARKLHAEAERMRLVLQEMNTRDREGIAREMQIQGIYATGTAESTPGCGELSSFVPVAADTMSTSPESRTVRPLVRSILADLHGVARSLPTLRLLESKNPSEKLTSLSNLSEAEVAKNDNQDIVSQPTDDNKLSTIFSASIQSNKMSQEASDNNAQDSTPDSALINPPVEQLAKRRPSLNPHFEWLRSRMRAVQQQPTQLQLQSSHSSSPSIRTIDTQENPPLINSVIHSSESTSVANLASNAPPAPLGNFSCWVPEVRVRGPSFHDTDNKLPASNSLTTYESNDDGIYQELPVDSDELSFIAKSHHDQQVIAVPGDAVDVCLSFTPSTLSNVFHAVADNVSSTSGRCCSAAPPIPPPRLSFSSSTLPPLASGPISSLAERAARVLHSSRPGSRSSSRRNSFQSGDVLLPDSLHYSVGSAGSSRRNSLDRDSLIIRRNSFVGVPTMTEMATQTTLINESHIMSSSSTQMFTTGETESSESNKHDVDVIPQPASLDNVAQVLRAAFINARQSIAACNKDKRQIISSNDDCMENEVNDDEDDEDTSVLRTLSSQSGVSKGLQHYVLPSLHQVRRLQTSIAKQQSPLKVIQPLVPKPSTSSCLDEDEEFALSVLNGPFIEVSSNTKQIEFGWYVRENAPLSPQPIIVGASERILSPSAESRKATSISGFMGFEEEDEEENRKREEKFSASKVACDWENQPMETRQMNRLLSSTLKRPSTASGSRMHTTTTTTTTTIKTKKSKKVKARKISTAVPLSSRPAWKPNGF
jgi:hypothetical protein